MILTIHPTSKVVQIVTAAGEVPARLWEGTSESGVPVHCYITRLAIPEDASPEIHQRFARELQEMRAPTAAVEALPLRILL